MRAAIELLRRSPHGPRQSFRRIETAFSQSARVNTYVRSRTKARFLLTFTIQSSTLNVPACIERGNPSSPKPMGYESGGIHIHASNVKI